MVEGILENGHGLLAIEDVLIEHSKNHVKDVVEIGF